MKIIIGFLVFVFVQTGWAVGEFPEGFRWCVATAAHQIEGNNHNSDWWVWEQTQGHIANHENSDPADDHWNRVREDVQLLKALHVKEYRFSVEWAKIEPSPGQFDQAAIDHYAFEVNLLQQQGIEPMITLQHFTLPIWVAHNGGWAWDGMPDAFAKYTEVVRKQIGPKVTDWMTVNEPMVTLLLGYVEGVFPPGVPDVVGKAGLELVIEPLTGMLKAHARAYQKIHEFDDQLGFARAKVSMAHHLRIFQAKSWWNPFDQLATWVSEKYFNWIIPDAIETGVLKMKIPFVVKVETQIPGLQGTEDYFGLNYYSRDQVHFSFTDPKWLVISVKEGAPVTDMGWEIYPEGLTQLLHKIYFKYPRLQIFVSENGIADQKDEQRPKFIAAHLQAVLSALSDGVPVAGYCYWSLYDNFEWINGYTPRFGLYEINYQSQKRTLRPSGNLFSEIAQRNSL